MSPGSDNFPRGGITGRLWLVWALVSAGVLIFLFARDFRPGRSSQLEVVAYCAQDEEYAEPIFRDFERETGCKVLAVYDNEAVKTVGLANRLLAERHNPQCDVFWGNEEMRTRQLAVQQVFRATNGWVALGHRSRRNSRSWPRRRRRQAPLSGDLSWRRQP